MGYGQYSVIHTIQEDCYEVSPLKTNLYVRGSPLIFSLPAFCNYYCPLLMWSIESPSANFHHCDHTNWKSIDHLSKKSSRTFHEQLHFSTKMKVHWKSISNKVHASYQKCIPMSMSINHCQAMQSNYVFFCFFVCFDAYINTLLLWSLRNLHFVVNLFTLVSVWD